MPGFIKRCDELSREGNEIEIDKIKSLDGFKYSYNHKSNINSDTKFVIVGTFTPSYSNRNEDRKNKDNMNSCYFYNGDKNLMYMFIDNAKKREDNLADLKNSLPDEEIVNKIKKILNDYKIAFLDVLEYGVLEDFNTSDDKITNFRLDYNAFENAHNINPNIKYMPNSKNALHALEIINERIGNKLTIVKRGNDNVYNQQPRGSGLGKGATDKLKKLWKELLNDK